MMTKYVVKVMGQSCDYYLSVGSSGSMMGVMDRADALRFVSEEAARAAGRWFFGQGKIGHWEVRREGQR